ncbi:MAG: acetyl-CoA carboxylase biotin carboxylase subunit [Candidatus Omnitrophica bacterium]|nr:acetyl-CoA carboxylase biotin carboxylase subunit [Candidatus Omnitrophota bacterium]
MFSKILIANRGEIAVRIIRACKELGIRTVAIYSEVDRDSLHVKYADEAICIGSSASSNSYLKISNIISAAEITDVDAIHPGYGFLAENAHFAEVCEECNIKFIGPTSQNVRLLGDKMAAKETMRKAGLPLIPGSLNVIKNKEETLKTAQRIKYPVIIKAAAGGGGRGMRIAHNDISLQGALIAAQAEAEAAFGNPNVYIEKCIENPRHIEFQILADRYGHIVHLGERDCSIQRKHQKLVEESPSCGIDQKLRKKIGDMAIRAAKAANYVNAGTVEFLLDRNNNFYFMEMNTRIQVEHPVTEMVTGIDMIKEQIRIASGERLSFNQDNIKITGHAIECRINAEDPSNGFMPSPGKIEMLHLPGGHGVRIDTHIYAGYIIPSFYDSLIAKLITYGNTRYEAIKTMQRVLDELIIEPIKTTISLHKRIVNDPLFLRGQIGTNFIQSFVEEGAK